MDLSPLLQSSWHVQMHTLAAVFALVVGALQFFLPKGTRRHRSVGWVWVLLMAVVAISSFFIHSMRWVGPFGPIHLLAGLFTFAPGRVLFNVLFPS